MWTLYAVKPFVNNSRKASLELKKTLGHECSKAVFGIFISLIFNSYAFSGHIPEMEDLIMPAERVQLKRCILSSKVCFLSKILDCFYKL